MNRSAKQVSIGSITDFLKQMNRLKMNPDLEHRIVHVRSITFRKRKG